MKVLFTVLAVVIIIIEFILHWENPNTKGAIPFTWFDSILVITCILYLFSSKKD